jgi:hypothetical protein
MLWHVCDAKWVDANSLKADQRIAGASFQDGLGARRAEGVASFNPGHHPYGCVVPSGMMVAR